MTKTPRAHSPDATALPEATRLASSGTAERREADTPPRHDRRDLRASILIGLCCLIIYNANLRAISAADAYAARYLPFAILKDHTVFLDSIGAIVAQGRGEKAWWIVTLDDGRSVSLYPVTLPLLITPLYLPATAYVNARGWTVSAFDRAARIMEKAAASLIAALSSSLLFLLMRHRAERRTALLLTMAYAFGTTTWMISSQALWQHGMAQLLVVSTLLFLTGRPTLVNALAGGLFCGLIAANRPPDAILAAALGAYGLYWSGRRIPFLIAGATLPLALLLFYNLEMIGNIGGGYGLVGRATFLQNKVFPGLAGLLLSPTRGLFVFSPFLLFLGMFWRHWPRGRAERILTIAILVAVFLQLFLYAKADWRGGMAWGPRFLTDLLPMLFWLLAPVAAALRPVAKTFFIIAVGVSITIEAVGAWYYTSSTDTAIYAIPSGPDRMRAAWNWQNAPFVKALENGPAPRELPIYIRGRLDELQVGGRSISRVTAGDQVVAAGWALADDEPPMQIGVMIDGRQGPASRNFFDRPDVRTTLGVQSPAGWAVSFDTAHLAPGDHRVAALAWQSKGGDMYYLGERTLTVVDAPRTGADGRPSSEDLPAGQPNTDGAGASDEDLDRAFETAAARIRDHQQGAGYWLTTFTSGTRFDQPRPEMNTFLTSFMIDLLDPVEDPAQMKESLRRARAHLSAQIEPGGLVRYHGRPDGPGIGTLGCAITPDTDDTALVWRLAPGDDRRELAAALRTIRKYRTADGLYRTWLAPREAYQCLDPGGDPNPPDIAIQMNLLLLLANERPDDARALCKAIRKVVDDDRVWVYYRVTPLIAMLRVPDLDRAGCALELPEERMRTSVQKQEIWVSALRLLLDAEKSSAVDGEEIRSLLEELSANDFAILRKNPPLLYHNDLTATVSRYYWSEDFGYALWLRLAHIHDRIQGKRADS